MATLVLTAVGAAIGGPIGGAIGSIIGQQVDRAVFAPKAREGARLKELAVQTSSYGTQIPAVFGVMRVAGTVIWATDLQERRVKSGGGKGRPPTVNYSYSVSMAVALSSRPIVGVGRIWADGNLLRGAGGDLKVDTQFRVHRGYADQPPDPLIASAEAAGQCPAHRGIAYAVFEDLQLADYGNRIPSLTFELFERDDAVAVNDIWQAASNGMVAADTIETVAGFALAGADARDGLSPLLDVLPVELSVREGRLSLSDEGVFAGNAAVIEIAASENGERFDPPGRVIEPASRYPQSLSLRYYDQARDYQAGVQQSSAGGPSRMASQIEFPAVLDAADAKRLVETNRLRVQRHRTGWRGDVVASANPISAGDWFSDAEGRRWQAEEVEYRFGSATIKARAATVASVVAGSGSPGRNLPSPDSIVGETRIAIVDLPVFDGADPGKAQVAVFAAGTESGWRRAALSLPGEAGLIEIGPTAAPAIMGEAVNALSPQNSMLIDRASRLKIALLNDAMDLADRSGSPLDSDAPLVWLDGEFMRVGKIEARGNRRYDFTELLRGCFRSGFAAPAHLPGSLLVILDAATARLLVEREYARGEKAAVEAIGLGDGQPVTAEAMVEALAITPLQPVHGEARKRSDGSIAARWIRRSRIDFGWRDGVDQPLVEESERYLISLFAGSMPVSEWLSDESRLLLDAATIVQLELQPEASLSLQVRQVGRYAQSDALVISVQ